MRHLSMRKRMPSTVPRTTTRPEPPTLGDARVETILNAAPEETLRAMNAARLRMLANEVRCRRLPPGAKRRALNKLVLKDIDTIAHAFVKLRDAAETAAKA
jgi:hypothetical protein